MSIQEAPASPPEGATSRGKTEAQVANQIQRISERLVERAAAMDDHLDATNTASTSRGQHGNWVDVDLKHDASGGLERGALSAEVIGRPKGKGLKGNLIPKPTEGHTTNTTVYPSAAFLEADDAKGYGLNDGGKAGFTNVQTTEIKALGHSGTVKGETYGSQGDRDLTLDESVTAAGRILGDQRQLLKERKEKKAPGPIKKIMNKAEKARNG